MRYLKLAFLLLALSFVVSACGGKGIELDELDGAQAVMEAAQQKNAEAEECSSDDTYNLAVEKYEESVAYLDEAAEVDAENPEERARLTELAIAAAVEAEELFEQTIKEVDDNIAQKEEATTMHEEAMMQYEDLEQDRANDPEAYEEAGKLLEEAQENINACNGFDAKANIDQAKYFMAIVAGEDVAGMDDGMDDGVDTMSGDSYTYSVVEGDTLWGISEAKYHDPFLWPLIYWANKADIEDPDLIFPEQIFNIMTDSTDDEKADAAHMAKTRGPWSLYDGK